MQDLFRSLQDRDLGHLRIIAELWGIDLPSAPPVEAARRLVSSMLDPGAAREQFESLPSEARLVLQTLQSHSGRLPLADLTRQFGELREMGPGRRDREKPWRTPVSALETLWYHGWLARAFAETPAGLQEFAFVPHDLAATLPSAAAAAAAPPGMAAPEPARAFPAVMHAADDATTLLAALRRKSAGPLPLPPGRSDSLAPFLHNPEAAALLLTLLREQGILIGPPIRPSPEATRRFLDVNRAEASRDLLRAWSVSEAWNDLAYTPGLSSPKGKWPNEPRLGREMLLRRVHDVPAAAWWDIGAFVEAVHTREPGFQRPGGDFDSWYLQEESSGQFLKGFETWDRVEGALIRFVLHGPLHWLGAVDLGAPAGEGPPSSFRLTPMAQALWDSRATELPPETQEPASLSSEGRVDVPPSASRAHRYQISRVARWELLDTKGYHFRLTPTSLQAAQEQGLQPHHVLSLLETACGHPADRGLGQAIQRAMTRGPQARLERSLVLRLSSPRILQALRADRACARLLGEPLGPSAVRLAERDWEKLCAVAARLGFLIEPPEP